MTHTEIYHERAAVEPEARVEGPVRLQRNRRTLAVLGLVTLVISIFTKSSNIVPWVALVLLTGAAVIMLWEARTHSPTDHKPVTIRWPEERSTLNSRAARLHRIRSSLPPYAILTALLVAISLTWYKSGTFLAGGDFSPPAGNAWIHELFSSWAWTGSTLGSPSPYQTDLFQAAVFWTVDHLDGSNILAQQIWMTSLVCMAGLCCVALLRTLGRSKLSSCVAALAYVLSPYVVSAGLPSTTMFLILTTIAYVAWVISALAKRPHHYLVRACLCGAPLTILLASLGVALPLLAMIPFVSVAIVLGTWLVSGRSAGVASFKATIALGVSALVLGAFWIPAIYLQIGSAATSSLSNASSWTWTEGRATLLNALWLNTVWGWSYKDYFSYAPDYSKGVMLLLRYAPTSIAYGGLAIVSRRNHTRQTIGIVSLAALASIVIMFISTGTRFPGSMIFDLLYSVPFGWLLREPGRFLVIADFALVILIAVALDAVGAWCRQVQLTTAESRIERWLQRRLVDENRHVASAVRAMAVAAIGIAVIVPGWPLVTGVIVPGANQSLPSDHVRLPGYWYRLANQLGKRFSPSTTLLALPEDTFYQVRYSWGFYGSDAFITQLLPVRVLDPAGQGYYPSSASLYNGVSLLEKASTAGNWDLVNDIERALGIDALLVRSDVVPTSVGGHLTDALLKDPLLERKLSDGPLSVFVNRVSRNLGAGTVATAVPVLSNDPNLADLALEPGHSALVSVSAPPRGRDSLFQVPPVALWPVTDGVAESNVNLDGADGAAAVGVVSNNGTVEKSWTLLSTSPVAAAENVTVSESGGAVHLATATSAVPSTATPLSSGPWEAVPGNCNNYLAVPAHDRSATVVKARGVSGPVLQLSAVADNACEWDTFEQPAGRSIVLRVMARSLSGAVPRACIEQSPTSICTTLTAVALAGKVRSGRGWHVYQAELPAHNTPLSPILYVNADTPSPGTVTVTQYADVQAFALPAPATFVVRAQTTQSATPARSSMAPYVYDSYSQYSSRWAASSPAGVHVVVNGVENGWLLKTRISGYPEVWFSGTKLLSMGYGVSVIGVAAMGAMGVVVLWTRRRRGQDRPVG